MENLVKAGRYKAKLVEHAITSTQAGEPQATVRFEFETEDGPRQLIWFGSFKEKAQEHTIKALLVCGLKENNPAGPLEIGKEVMITVDVDVDQQGKGRNVIRWINKLGISNALDKNEAKAKLDKFSGAVMSLKQKEGLGLKNHAEEKDPWDN